MGFESPAFNNKTSNQLKLKIIVRESKYSLDALNYLFLGNCNCLMQQNNEINISRCEKDKNLLFKNIIQFVQLYLNMQLYIIFEK